MIGRPPKSTLAHPNIGASSAIAGAPTCPKYLDAIAKKKWRSTVKLMEAAGILTKLDGDLLALYCESFSRYQEAHKQLKRKYTLRNKGASYQNPLLSIANKAQEQMTKLARYLGIEKMTATRLGVDGKPPTVRGVAKRDRSKGLPPPPKAEGAS